jgi:catechol 2,3-dioxygenase-like lactoylglutathione lyase family enzyme
MHLHHISIKTADIFRSIAFYERLGFTAETRFTAGITLACWLTGPLGRLELMQVPEPQTLPDPFGDAGYVGYYHLSIGVESLEETLTHFQDVTLLLSPTQQQIGENLYQVAFIADPDGLPIELIQLVLS